MKLQAAILGLVAAMSAAAQSPTPKISAGALACYAVRRTPVATVPSALNVQSYCYLGKAIVSNSSNLIAPRGSVIVVHIYGVGCGVTTPDPKTCDAVSWQFFDSGGVIGYQVAANGGGVVQGIVP